MRRGVKYDILLHLFGLAKVLIPWTSQVIFSARRGVVERFKNKNRRGQFWPRRLHSQSTPIPI